MIDLNDMRLFAEVAETGGFAAAARRLGVPRSRVSRRIALLEERLGVRLVQRTTRQFAVTEIGREYQRHCVAMLVEARAAQEAIERQRAEPQGIVRMTCPPSVIYFQIGDMLARFMADCPKVVVVLEGTNRRVDILGEGIDIAIRVRFPPLEDSDLVIRRLAESRQRLVASPVLLARHPEPAEPADLARLPSLGWGPADQQHEWRLADRDGTTEVVRHQPRLVTEDMIALRLAALRGVGAGRFPEMVVRDDLAAGRLVDVLPGWVPPAGIIHALFASRRGLLPSVRALLDCLATGYSALGDDRAEEPV